MAPRPHRLPGLAPPPPSRSRALPAIGLAQAALPAIGFTPAATPPLACRAIGHAFPGRSPYHWLRPRGPAPSLARPPVGLAPHPSSGSLFHWPLAPGSLSSKTRRGSQLFAVVCSRGHLPSRLTSLLLCLRLVLFSAGSVSPGLDP